MPPKKTTRPRTNRRDLTERNLDAQKKRDAKIHVALATHSVSLQDLESKVGDLIRRVAQLEQRPKFSMFGR